MSDIFNKNNLAYRSIACALAILHLVTFGPVGDVFAFSAKSASYRLSSGTVNEGGKARRAASARLWQDAIGESAIGKARSANFILNAGLLAAIQSNLPVSAHISYQTWPINSANNNAFDLDDYFSSPEGYALSFRVIGNSNITVTIDPDTHSVSFSQPEAWFGVEKAYFIATDTEGNAAQSNEVVLQVANSAGQPNKPVIVDKILSPSIIKEGDLVTLKVKARDLDDQDISFTYSSYFTETKRYKEGDLWVSEAAWQTGVQSTGHYTASVTVSDSVLNDTGSVRVSIGNFNHPPVLDPIPDITANEGDLVVIQPHATDSDNDPITYYFPAPFDTQGKWLTGYDTAGTYDIQVTASDGIDTVFRNAKVIINNTNREPQASLTLNKYTVGPNEPITVTLRATDPDGDSMTFILRKDGEQIASGAISDTYPATVTFSQIAHHDITAVVTDSGGKSATVSRGVDVTYPNDAVNPVMGDFNGDALTDLGLHDSTTGKWEVAISDHGVFREAVPWPTPPNFGNSREWWPISGDFNGDGRTDIGVYNNATGELKTALSNGSNFVTAGSGLTFSGAPYSWQPFTGNFNADKYTDFALYNKDTGEVKVAMGAVSGFDAPGTWAANLGNDCIALGGDFNGDSFSDLCLFKKSSGEFKVALSDSRKFVGCSVWLSGFAADKDVLVSDFNNDGLTDIGYWDKSDGKWYYAASTGSSSIKNEEAWLDSFGADNCESATTGDFDGDGVTDAATFDRDRLGIDRWDTRISSKEPADLLTEIDNGMGGKTRVTYAEAAAGDNPDVPFPVYVASSTSLVNARPAERAAEYTQNFIFSGGYYDADEREFRGFAKVRVTDPVTGNYAETYFHQGRPGQDGALKGQIEKVDAYDGNGRQISRALNVYEVKKAGPVDRFLGFPALVEQTTAVWEENASLLTTRDKITYDNIGNPLEQVNEGDASKTGDKKTAAATFAQAYEAGYNRPLEAVVKDKDGNTISRKNFEYDSKGNLLKETAWLNTSPPDAQPFTQYSYDSFGNVTMTANARGSSVTTDYETDFYTYPEKITNSMDHSVQYVYEPKFGVVKSVTDTNGSTSSTTYDNLGRPEQVRNAYGQITVAYAYPNFTTKITWQNGLTKIEDIDGLGRKYETFSSGEDGSSGRQVVTETFYNNRGQVDKESLPHYRYEDPSQISYIRYEYDIRGRVKKTISDFPGTASDAEVSVNYINPLYTETTDPKGHRKGAQKDIYGNIIEVKEFVQGHPDTHPDGAFHTYYEYNNQNNLVKTTDNQKNVTQVFYDSLGRKIRMVDPDMGTWLYEYDLVGNLRKQTDAKGQILNFEYDAINRLTLKSSLRAAEGGEAISIAQYTYDDPGKTDCVGRISKITDQSGSTEFFYDKLGREVKSIKTIDGTPYSVERGYDVLDRLVTLKYPDAEVVTYSYDANSGLLEKVQGARTYVQDIAYNANGQMKAIQYGNGTSTAYIYGQDLRLSRIYTQGMSAQGLTPLQDLNYAFDKNGNVATLTDNIATRRNIRQFRYDGLDRLIEEERDGSLVSWYQYDSIGNMTYKSDIGAMVYGQAAGPHALTQAGGYSYQYDANGNMTVGKNKTMVYDAENRLISLDHGLLSENYLYDGDGGRVLKVTRNQSTETRTTYIGSLYEISSDGVIRKYIFAGANRVASVESTGNIYYTHSDHLGSSNVITDQNGQQVQYCEYTPYGSLARNDGADVTTHKFTGKELDNTGLYFYGARYYDPEIGRFITADTIVQAPYNPQSLNRYSYARNNPVVYTDPTGHFWFIAAIIIGAILGGVSSAVNGQPIWQGALMGALGGALVAGGGAAFGFWGAVTGGVFSGAGSAVVSGGNIGFGALCGGIGAGLGYGLGSWADGWHSGSFWGELGASAFSGGVAGGLGSELSGRSFGQGAWMGAAYGTAGFMGSKMINELDPTYRQQQKCNQAAKIKHDLNVKKNDMIKVPLTRRQVVGPAGHQTVNNWEMGPIAGGEIKTTNTVSDLKNWGTYQNTKNGVDVRATTVEVSASGLVEATQMYEQYWVDTHMHYNAFNCNSNYAVNTVIYAAGGNVPQGIGYNPSFSNAPSSLFYLPFTQGE